MAVRRTLAAKLFVEGLRMVGFVAEIGGAEPKRRTRDRDDRIGSGRR